MPILETAIARAEPQRDGRFHVRETHSDGLNSYEFAYLAEPGTDIAAIAAARVASIDAALIEDDIKRAMQQILSLGSQASIALAHATTAQLRSRIRTRFRNAARTDAVMLGDFLAQLTDAQLAALFGLTLSQVATLRVSKLDPARTAADTLRALVGE